MKLQSNPEKKGQKQSSAVGQWWCERQLRTMSTSGLRVEIRLRCIHLFPRIILLVTRYLLYDVHATRNSVRVEQTP